jgi:hypothetical protein
VISRSRPVAVHSAAQRWLRALTRGCDRRKAAPQASAPLRAGTSYARAMQNPEVEKKVTSVADDYGRLWRELRKAGAKGVVVAINGRITWANVFATTDLLEKYWQKLILIRSYAADSLTNVSSGG